MTATKKKWLIVAIVLVACIGMGLVDALWQPIYWVKSAVKIGLFLLLPALYALLDRDFKVKSLFIPDKRGFGLALLLGAAVYGVVVGAYFLFRGIFDFSAVASSVTDAVGVSKDNFIPVAIYISFANSLLEEFFFRGFAFLTLKKVSGRRFAYLFGAGMFAVYHIAMMIGWFALPVVLLALLGLFLGGVIFSYFNERYDNIYLSWLIHMCANFATNTIGFILFAAG